MKGILYGVGVGPGDPELMTLKAVRIIEENDVIAVPGKIPEETAAYKIASAVIPSLAEKKLLPMDMPMVKDREIIKSEHEKCAKIIEGFLGSGKNVVYITLGDPTIYSTFGYLQKIIAKDGFETEYISGIPSFCAAAAKLGQPLAEWNEPLHIIPAFHKNNNSIHSCDGNYILMKSGKDIKQLKETLKKERFSENCGMECQRIYRSIEEFPDNAGYFFLIMAKKS